MRNESVRGNYTKLNQKKFAGPHTINADDIYRVIEVYCLDRTELGAKISRLAFLSRFEIVELE